MVVELVVARWFASLIISRVSNLLMEYTTNKIKCHKNIKTNFESLTKNLHKIETAIHEAERRPIDNPGLQKWLFQLKDAVYDAEDVLDTFSYEILRVKVMGKSKKGGDAGELDKIVRKFQGLVNEMGFFLKVVELNDKNGSNQSLANATDWRITTPSQKQPSLVGRDTEVIDLMSFLFQSASHDGKTFSSVSLLGVGGVGKTALARVTYNHPRVERHFDIRAWVCVTHVFDVKSLMIMFIESAALKRPRNFHKTKHLGAIQKIIADGLRGKRFLVVFDDVWNSKEIIDWFFVLFNHGEKGSRIVVTTRHESTATHLGTTKKIYVEGLKFNECQSLLHQHAFRHVKMPHPSLECMGQDITKSLCGLPLVVETIGCALGQNLIRKHWKEIMAKNIYTVSIEQPENKLLRIMRLSYEQLRDGALQQCFLSCSLFPYEHKFSKTEFIRIWMALGFLCPKDEHTTMETVGENYFNDLVNRHFFKKVNSKSTVPDYSKSSTLPDVSYEVHAALHRLAEFLCFGEYYRVVRPGNDNTHSSDIVIPDRCRHVSLDVNDLNRGSASLKRKTNLRSLIITGQLSQYPKKTVNPLITLEKILKELKCLRMLILSDLVPGSFDQLRHLRYFKVGFMNDDNNESPTTLPDWLRKCYQLQSLAAEFDRKILFLPKHINRLVMLRWLETKPEIVNTIPGIGKMISLQEVREFHVERKAGYGIDQLREMNELKGSLCISHLENVESLDDAKKAELDQKEHLHSLELCWSKRKLAKLPDDHVVLEGLKPHDHICKLELNGYMGTKFPTWLRDLEYLEQLSLFHCANFHSAMLGELKNMFSLKVLTIFNCPGIHSLSKNMLPPNLEKLNIMGKISTYQKPKVRTTPSSPQILSYENTTVPKHSTILPQTHSMTSRSTILPYTNVKAR
ncbi:hypothetical protein LUZ60_014005 [Juncus effusus]|nr:hypothetical protein LUZ60_014005 [Juncus effusus]